MRNERLTPDTGMPGGPHSPPEDVVTFPPSLEARLMRSLRDIFGAHEAAQRALPVEVRTELTAAVNALVKRAGRGEKLASATILAPCEFARQYAHPVKVAELAIVMGRRKAMRTEELVDLAMAAVLMNLGYAALRRRIVTEPRLLDDRVWQEAVKQHPLLTAQILSESRLGRTVIETIEQHHERHDGSGYPSGLTGDEISPSAQLLAVADAYVSLCLGSSSRDALPPDRALGAIVARAGSLFEPSAVGLLGQALVETQNVADAWVLNPDERDRVVRTLRRMSADRALPFSRGARRAAAAPAAATVRSANALSPEALMPEVLVPEYLAPAPEPAAEWNARSSPQASRGRTSAPVRRRLRGIPARRRRPSLWSKERYLAARQVGWGRAVARS